MGLRLGLTMMLFFTVGIGCSITMKECTVDLAYSITNEITEINTLYPKIRYKGGRLIINVPSQTCCLVRYMHQNAISEGVISKVHSSKCALRNQKCTVHTLSLKMLYLS